MEDKTIISERNKDEFKNWLLEKGYDNAQVENILAALHYFSGYCVQQLQCAELMTIETSSELDEIRERLIKRLFATFDQYHRFMREREAPPASLLTDAPAEEPPVAKEPAEPSPVPDAETEALPDEAAPEASPVVSPDEVPGPLPDGPSLDGGIVSAVPVLEAAVEIPPAELPLEEAQDDVASEGAEEEGPIGEDPRIQEIEKFILDSGVDGATLEDVVGALPPDIKAELDDNALRELLDGAPHIVPMPKGRYVHADAFTELEGARETLQGIMTEHFSWFGGHINMWLLFDEASKKLPDFLRKNHCGNRTALYAVTRYLFGKGAKDGVRFVFEPPRILDPSRPVSEFV